MRLFDVIANDIDEERGRQEELRERGKFRWTNAAPEMPIGDKIAVLGEEFGEVCKAVLNVQGLSTDGPEHSDLRKELVQLAAVTIAWIEAIDFQPAPPAKEQP